MRVLLVSLFVAVATTSPAGAASPTPPGASTQAATDITQTSAELHASVHPNNGETTYDFQYGTSSSYGLTTVDQTTPASSATVGVAAAVDKLTASTTYHFRIVATNAAGTVMGGDRTLRTGAAPSRPAAATDGAQAVSPSGATLKGRVDANGQATTYVFEYGTSARYGASTPPAAAGDGASSTSVSARLEGLTANTRYHYRLRATNSTGSTTGADRTFRTSKVPLSLSAAASSPSLRYGSPLTVSGLITGTDRSRVPVILERTNFPYDLGFRPFGTQQLTDGTGAVHFSVPPFTVSSRFRLRVPTKPDLVSAPVTVTVRALVGFRVKRLQGRRVRLVGTVAPGGATGSVSVQVRRGDRRFVAVRRVALRVGTDLSRFFVVLHERRVATTYRIVTRLTGGALLNGTSQPRRVLAR